MNTTREYDPGTVHVHVQDITWRSEVPEVRVCFYGSIRSVLCVRKMHRPCLPCSNTTMSSTQCYTVDIRYDATRAHGDAMWKLNWWIGWLRHCGAIEGFPGCINRQYGHGVCVSRVHRTYESYEVAKVIGIERWSERYLRPSIVRVRVYWGLSWSSPCSNKHLTNLILRTLHCTVRWVSN